VDELPLKILVRTVAGMIADDRFAWPARASYTVWNFRETDRLTRKTKVILKPSRICINADVHKKGGRRKERRISCQDDLLLIQYSAAQSTEVSIVTFGIAAMN
jgi:hypothetical protein